MPPRHREDKGSAVVTGEDPQNPDEDRHAAGQRPWCSVDPAHRAAAESEKGGKIGLTDCGEPTGVARPLHGCGWSRGWGMLQSRGRRKVYCLIGRQVTSTLKRRSVWCPFW